MDNYQFAQIIEKQNFTELTQIFIFNLQQCKTSTQIIKSKINN